MKKKNNVLIYFDEDSLIYRNGYKQQILTNITEIHYNWSGDGRIIFESDVERTGYVYNIGDILEFEYTIQDKKRGGVLLWL